MGDPVLRASRRESCNAASRCRGRSQAHPVRRVRRGFDHHPSGLVAHIAHRLHGVQQQIDDDLPQLDPIAGDGGRSSASSTRAITRLARSSPEARAITSRAAAFRSTASAVAAAWRTGRASRYHIGHAARVADDPSGLSRARPQVAPAARPASQANAGVGDDPRQRLIDFMHDRRGQRADAGHLAEVGRPERALSKASSDRRCRVMSCDRADVSIYRPDPGPDAPRRAPVSEPRPRHRQAAFEIDRAGAARRVIRRVTSGHPG